MLFLFFFLYLDIYTLQLFYPHTCLHTHQAVLGIWLCIVAVCCIWIGAPIPSPTGLCFPSLTELFNDSGPVAFVFMPNI